MKKNDKIMLKINMIILIKSKSKPLIAVFW
jgi:hypothetical protein